MTKPPFVRPLCEHPVLIVNRRAIDLMHRCGYYTYRGVEYKAWLDYFSFEPNYSRWLKKARFFYTKYRIGDTFYNKYDWEGLSTCYVQSGCMFEYLFLVVPCRKCPICIESKRNDYVARCSFESQTSSTPPVMVTLTYEPKFLPHEIHFHHIEAFNRDNDFDKNHIRSNDYNDDFYCPHSKRFSYRETSVFYRDGNIRSFGDGDLCLRDVQLFLKKLRIRLLRAGYPPVNMRYVCCGEYGSKFGRPHYHFLFWNVPLPIKTRYDFLYLDMFKTFILDSWNMCIEKSCKVEVARSAARYVTKYMTKIDRYGRKGFFLASRGSRGSDYKGIGSKFLKENASFFYDHPTMHVIPFVDKWSGELTQYTFGSYALQKVFLSSSQYLSRGVYKKRYKQLCQAGSYVSWLFDHISYYNVRNTPHYKDCMKFVEDLCLESNFAWHSDVCHYSPAQYFKWPPSLGYISSSFSKVDPNRGYGDGSLDDVALRESIAEKYFSAFLDMAYEFWNDYYDVIDDGYLCYLDGLRMTHFDYMPPREVTDDLISSMCTTIREKWVVDSDREVF